MRRRYRLSAELPVEVTQLDGGEWRAVCVPLGLVSFGGTSEDALDKIEEGFNALGEYFLAHREGRAKLEEHLRARELPFETEEEPVPEVPNGIVTLRGGVSRVLEPA